MTENELAVQETVEEKKNILTYEGLKAYEDELHDLKVVRRKEVAEKIKEAREQGDLSENAEYDAAKEAQGMLEMKIAQLKDTLSNARVIDESKISNDTIQILSKVSEGIPCLIRIYVAGSNHNGSHK